MSIEILNAVLENKSLLDTITDNYDIVPTKEQLSNFDIEVSKMVLEIDSIIKSHERYTKYNTLVFLSLLKSPHWTEPRKIITDFDVFINSLYSDAAGLVNQFNKQTPEVNYVSV